MDNNQKTDNMETADIAEPNVINEGEAVSAYNFDLARRKMWELAIFFVLGWAIIAISFGFGINPITFLLGSAVLGFPSLKIVYRGGFKAAFNTEYYIVTTYADGHKETNYDFAGNTVFKIFGLILAICLGVAITPIRMLLFMSKYRKYQKELGVEKPPLAESVWFPPLVMAAAFIIFIIVGVIIGKVQEYKFENVSDFTDEEIIEIVNKAEEEINTHTITYSYTSPDNMKCNIDVERTYADGKAKYEFTVSQGKKTDYTDGGWVTTDIPESESKIPWGTYIYTNGAFDASLSDEAKKFLVKLTLEEIFGFDKMRESLDGYVVNKDATIQIRCYYEKGESYSYYLYEDDYRVYDLVRYPLFDQDSGGGTIRDLKYN